MIPSHIALILAGKARALPLQSIVKPANRVPEFTPAQSSTQRASRLQDAIACCDDIETHDMPDMSQGFALAVDTL